MPVISAVLRTAISSVGLMVHRSGKAAVFGLGVGSLSAVSTLWTSPLSPCSVIVHSIFLTIVFLSLSTNISFLRFFTVL